MTMQAQGMPEGGSEVPKITERPPNSLRGLVGELWQGDRRVGTLWKWTLIGTNGKWGGDAQKYALDADFDDGEVECRLLVEAKGVRILEIRAQGRLIQPYTADGQMQVGSVELRGEAIAFA